MFFRRRIIIHIINYFIGNCKTGILQNVLNPLTVRPRCGII